jgi:hypothetical protein
MGRMARAALVVAGGLALLVGCTISNPKPCYRWEPQPVYVEVPRERVVTDRIRGELNEAKYDTLAVYPFQVAGYDSAGAHACADRVEQWLVARDEFEIVGRDSVEAVLDEQNTAEAARFDSVTVTTIGSLVGAKAVVVGSLYGPPPEPSWSLQIIDAETGQLAWGKNGTGLLEEQIDDTLGPLVDQEISRTESYMATVVERVDAVKTEIPCPGSE